METFWWHITTWYRWRSYRLRRCVVCSLFQHRIGSISELRVFVTRLSSTLASCVQFAYPVCSSSQNLAHLIFFKQISLFTVFLWHRGLIWWNVVSVVFCQPVPVCSTCRYVPFPIPPELFIWARSLFRDTLRLIQCQSSRCLFVPVNLRLLSFALRLPVASADTSKIL